MNIVSKETLDNFRTTQNKSLKLKLQVIKVTSVGTMKNADI